MKPFLAVLTTLTLLALSANAVPVCFPQPEALALQPTTADFNGQPVSRSTTTGRYTTDAGLEFDHELARLTAQVAMNDPTCPQPAAQLTLELVDPFSGERRTIGLEVTP